MSKIREKAAENIKYYRTLRQLSQEILAERAGISSGMIGKIEARLSSPSLESLYSIAGALDVEPYLLIIDPEDRNKFDRPEIESFVNEFKLFLRTRAENQETIHRES